MGLFKSFKKEKEIFVNSPIDGNIKKLETLNDGVFSDYLLGQGCAIQSDNNIIHSPFDGQVVMTTESKHAIGLLSDDGVEILIHIGLDTVMMEGKGFEIFVQKGDKIHTGQKLIAFSKEKIKEAGYSDDVIIIVSNTKVYKDVVCTKQMEIKEGDRLFTVYK